MLASALALFLAQTALRRIRLDREHIRRLSETLYEDGQIPLTKKRVLYVGLAEGLMRKAGTAASVLPVRACSQHGEDLILWDFFERKLGGFYVDVGAHDGLSISNTYFFESIGWTGICIEALPEMAERCAKLRKTSTVVQAALGDESANGTVRFNIAEDNTCLSSIEADVLRRDLGAGPGRRRTSVEVPYTNLTRVLEHVTSPIDFISIDVEGSELSVLRGLDLKGFRPAVLLIEDNSCGRDHTVRDYLATFSYRRVLTAGVNDFYIGTEETRRFLI
jgi:FkbM family methyltransferase